MINRRHALAAAAVAIGAISLSARTDAQTPPAPPAPESPYAVTYLEVEPKKADAARKMLKAYRDASAKGTGVVQFEAFERIGYKSHFAIVEQWASAKAREDHAGSAAGKAFRSEITPILITAYDERPHYALSVGPKAATPAPLYAITHADIIPPKKDEGVANTKKLADVSRGTPGNIRFDALTQASRPNHMTIVESWANRAAQDAHTVAGPTKAYRNGLLPMSGSLYDERLYTLMK